MKKVLLCIVAFGMLGANPIWAANNGAAKTNRFYGKITAVDASHKTLTVFNKNKQAESTFSWTDTTAITNNKKPMQAHELTVGQFLMVSYAGEGDKQVASQIAVRQLPGNKKVTQ